MALVRRFLTSPDEVADTIKTQRKELGMTQLQVADHAGVTRQFVSSVERGHPTADLNKVLAVLRAVDVMTLAFPVPVPASSQSDVHHIDLKAHLASYLAGT